MKYFQHKHPSRIQNRDHLTCLEGYPVGENVVMICSAFMNVGPSMEIAVPCWREKGGLN
jgi:hypothetical protein